MDWISDDMTFCLSDCDDMDCDRNKKSIRHPEIPHSYANFEGNENFCHKVFKNGKDYQPGVWYGADIQAPYNKLCIVVCGNEMSVDSVFAGTRIYVEPPYYAKKAPSIVWTLTSPSNVRFTVDDKDVEYWMLIPDVPEE